MIKVKENCLNIIKLSSSTKYILNDNALQLFCLRTNKQLEIVGPSYLLYLLLNSLLVGSPIDTIKTILNMIDNNYYNILEEGGFLE